MLDQLNPEQRAAATHLHGPLLVLAGAGTGKTMVITCRIASLLQAGIAPANILAVTFTNKAAREMKERIARLLPQVGAGQLTVATFHSFCCRLLRQHIHHLGYDRHFGIADDGDQDDLIKQASGELGVRPTEENSVANFRIGISQCKNEMLSPEGCRTASRNPWFGILANVYERYQALLKDMNKVDFDDLLLLVVRLWQQHPEVLAQHRQQYRYLLVDEFQDTNLVQAELVRLLAGPDRNLCVVGDDDQSIYGWRGANIENILDFPSQYPGTRVIKLEQNYRSTNSILKVANRLIANNDKRHGKELWSAKAEGDQIRLVECDSEADEGRLIGLLIKEAARERRLPYSDMAVLYRSKYQSRVIEQELRKLQLPYRLVGSRSFYEQREIKDAVAYLRLLHNERDEQSLLRILNVPPRGIGSKSIERLREVRTTRGCTLLTATREQASAGQLGDAGRAFMHAYDTARDALREPGQLALKLERYLSDMGYLPGLKKIYKNHEEALQRQENLLELISAVAQYEEQRGPLVTLESFLEDFSLTDDNDRVDEKSEDGSGVTLMTVHAAKGLEFPLVFIAGMEDKLFPHERSLKDNDLAEERRLFYVAVTRAKEQLILTRCRTRTRYDGRYSPRPSRFLGELPEELVKLDTQHTALKVATKEERDQFFDEWRKRYPK